MLYTVVGIGLIFALAEGTLWLTTVVYETRVVLAFALGVVVLGEREHRTRRGIAAVLCVVGIGLAHLDG